jgi:hypothetical protein
MRIVSISVMLIVFFCATNYAQEERDNFHIVYGSRDGSVMNVFLGDTIEVPCWGATAVPGEGPGSYDTVTFMHNPLLTNDDYVILRMGGFYPDTLVGRWEDASFLPPSTNDNDTLIPAGYTNQSMFAIAFIAWPYGEHNWIYTGGDTVLLGTFLMRVTTDPQYSGQTVCPFSPGYDPDNHYIYWGTPDGTGFRPVQAYGCIHLGIRCDYVVGDANDNGAFNGLDVTYSVAYFKGGPPPPYECECPVGSGSFWFVAGDVNGSCNFNGLDVTYMVAYLKGGPPPITCPGCLPEE